MRPTIHRSDSNQAEIVQTLRVRGFNVYILGRPTDLLVSKHGKDTLIEIKDPKVQGRKNEYTRAQKNFYLSWTGRPIPTLRTVEEALKFEIP